MPRPRRGRDLRESRDLEDCESIVEEKTAPSEPSPDDAPSLPEQRDFYKMPAKFGHVPVAEAAPRLGSKASLRAPISRDVDLPFQIVERFEFGTPELKPNQLFFGDNLHVMRSLPSESIDLIYIDPPFFSQKTYNVLFGDRNDSAPSRTFGMVA